MRRPTPLPVSERRAPQPVEVEAPSSVVLPARGVAEQRPADEPVIAHDPSADTEPITVVGEAPAAALAASDHDPVVNARTQADAGPAAPPMIAAPLPAIPAPGDPAATAPLETAAAPGAAPSRLSSVSLPPGLLPTQDPAPSAESEPQPVRLRDVWRASRARRKALRAEVRRFTVRARRRRAVWIGAAASLLVLVLGSLGAAYSPLFAVENIRVVGGDQLDTAAVQSALADEVGTPLPLVDASAVKAALLAFPLIETYTLEARPPHDLVVRVVERTPIGAVSSAAGFTVVDAAGVALATTAAAPPGQPLLTVRGGVRSDAFAAVGLVMRSLPEPIRLQVTAVAATSPDDVILTLGGTNTQVVWGSAEESAMKSVVLETTMAARPPQGVSVYDVSSPTAVVVR